MITGILLAAGQSTRFGSDKLLHELDGRPLVSYSLQAAVDSRLPKIVVVTGPDASAIEGVLRGMPKARDKSIIINNLHAEHGMMSSLKTGLRALHPKCDAAMVILADMPYVTSDLIDGLIRTFEETNGIVIPECDGVLYHPRAIPRRLFAEFLALDDRGSGQSVIDKHREDIVTLKTEKKTSFIDIDKARDLER